MQNPSRTELYRRFMEFVRAEAQKERSAANQRILSVFAWCFLLPAIFSASMLLLVKLGIFHHRAKNYIDWLVLVFPVSYSLYFLSSEVLVEVPIAFRRGAMAMVLGQAIKEGDWRERVSEDMKKAIPNATIEDWRWLIASFKLDLEAMKYRTRYLTALGGAVFFLIVQGIDSITEPDKPTAWIRDPLHGVWWESASNDLSQFVGLALFLILLYLSGSHTAHTLERFLAVAELQMITLSEAEKNR